MKTISFYVEVKKSQNFQTYTSGETVELEEGDSELFSLDEQKQMVMTRCRRDVMNQIAIDKR